MKHLILFGIVGIILTSTKQPVCAMEHRNDTLMYKHSLDFALYLPLLEYMPYTTDIDSQNTTN